MSFEQCYLSDFFVYRQIEISDSTDISFLVLPAQLLG